MRGLEGVQVGDTLYLFSVNDRARRAGGPRGEGVPVVVTKVGRKLVTVERHGRPFQYRIETGSANDDYQHEWLETAETREHKAKVEEAWKLLASLGLSRTTGRGGCSDEQLLVIADRLRDLVTS